MPKIQAVLFDLDGTVADTAPDLAFAANSLRLADGVPPLPVEILRPFASQGARGLLREAVGLPVCVFCHSMNRISVFILGYFPVLTSC